MEKEKLREIITEIQSLGVRVPSGVEGRRGGAGPAEGRALIVGGRAVHVPVSAPFAARSPYALTPTGDGAGWVLRKGAHTLCEVGVVPDPRFYGSADGDGVEFRRIALLHGRDCLASTVLQQCRHWRTARRCRFCGTEISLRNGATLAVKSPAQLAAAALAARRLDGVAHVVLTAGSGDPPGSEIAYLGECAAAVKAASGLPVHVQFAPPRDPGRIERLRESGGVDTVGIHVESFDPGVLARVAPAKAAIGLAGYEAAWKRSVALFGAGQVSSFVIAGLGETPRSILWGSEMLADLGVYPFVVPLRPIPGSRMADRLPPDPEIMKSVYAGVAEILSRKGISQSDCRAGCVRCGACSALPAYEKAPSRLIFRSARNPGEQAAAFAVRNEVFVREQKLFAESDIDDNDPRSVHLVAELDGEIVGTVRVYPTGTNGRWVGGRLAVRPANRVYRVGAGLVKEAMKRVKKRRCSRFTAHIQQENIAFFERLGWTAVGETEQLFGRAHQRMVADLDRVDDL